MIAHPDSVGAFAAGFVNSYASGYAADTLTCWVILTAWIAFEAKTKGVRHGWICALLGVVPGVAVGFAGYLLLRGRQGLRPRALRLRDFHQSRQTSVIRGLAGGLVPGERTKNFGMHNV